MSPRPRRRSSRFSWLSACLVAPLLYTLLVPWLWSARSWPDEGVLSADRPHLAAGERLIEGGPTAQEVIDAEHDSWGDCSDDTQYAVTGGLVGGTPYLAVLDLVDGEVCSVGIYDGRTAEDLYEDDFGVELVRVAKAGGLWSKVGTVKSAEELWLGAGALLVFPVQGYSYYRRWRPPFRPWRRRRVVGRVLLLASLVLSALATAAVATDVLFLPDLLGAVVTGLLVVQVLLATIGCRWVVAPNDFGEPRRGQVEEGRVPWRLLANQVWGRLKGMRLRRGRGNKALVPRKDDGGLTSALGPVIPPGRFRVVHTGELPHYAAVGGMQTVKDHLDETLGLLLAFADEAGDYRITFNGILLHGPPGVGKTFLAKAVAGEYGLSFLHVTAGDLVTGINGGAAQRVEQAFQTAAANVPCVLFFDEFDALARERSAEPDQDSRRTLAQLLTSLEKHRELRDLVVIAATNDLEGLDPAVIRPGRFDRHIRLDLPDASGRLAVLRACLQGRPVAAGIALEDVVRRTEGRSSAALASVVESAALLAFRQATESGGDVPIEGRHLLQAVSAQGGKDRPTIEQWSWERLVLPPQVLLELRQLEQLLEQPERAEAYGVRPPSGLLLTGPPGTGKTTVARVLAAEAECSFYPVTAADLMSKWVGESEEAVQRLFRRARENAPSIVSIDEIDALASRRGAATEHADRLLDQLLIEMDGIGSRAGVFVLAATNRPDILDPALLRGGRLSRTLFLDLPDVTARLALLELQAARMPLVGVRLVEVARMTAGWSGADLEALCQQAALAAMTRQAASSAPASVTVNDFRAAYDALARPDTDRSS